MSVDALRALIIKYGPDARLVDVLEAEMRANVAGAQAWAEELRQLLDADEATEILDTEGVEHE